MDDNTYECPNCGAKIYPETTRCPQCGQNMYPEEDDRTQVEAQATTSTWVSFLSTLLIGWMIASGIALIVHFVVDAFVSPFALGLWGKIILYIAGPFGTLVGAYVGTGLFKRRYKLLGGVVGVFTLPVLALLATHWVLVTFSLLVSPLGLLLGFLTIFAGVVGGWLAEYFAPENELKEKRKVYGWEDLLYQDLLRKTSFNSSAADRLIDYERKQDPTASRLRLIQSAIERWERDNR
jgi:hypothetical protein